jgi:transposase
MLSELPDDLDRLDGKVAQITGRLGLYMVPHADLMKRLTTIPGVDKIVAWTIIAEIGTDMSPFPDADHLAGWVAICLGNNETAGNRAEPGRVTGI